MFGKCDMVLYNKTVVFAGLLNFLHRQNKSFLPGSAAFDTLMFLRNQSGDVFGAIDIRLCIWSIFNLTAIALPLHSGINTINQSASKSGLAVPLGGGIP